VSLLRDWWKALLGFILAVLGLLALRRRQPSSPPGRPGPAEEAAERHDERVQDADDRLVEELLKPGDQRYRDAADYLRRKRPKP